MTADEQFLTGQNLPGGQLSGGRHPPSAGDLFETFTDDPFSTRPAASPAEVRNALRAAMGEDVPRAPRPPAYPDLSGLTEQLGLALWPGA